MKLKIIKTLYLDHDDNEYYEDKPINTWNNIYKLKAGEDYTVLRVGLTGKVYQEDDHVEVVGKGWSIIFKDMKDIMSLVGDWFQIIS